MSQPDRSSKQSGQGLRTKLFQAPPIDEPSGAANLWTGALAENEQPLTFDHAAKRAKALVEAGGVKVALRTAHKAITRRQTNSLGYVSFASKLILSIPPRRTQTNDLGLKGGGHALG